MITKLSPLNLFGMLLKLRMVAANPTQKVVTSHGDRFDLMKLGLYRTPSEPSTEDAPSSGRDQLENVELVQLQPRTHYQKHRHDHSDAVIYIIRGRGRLLLGSDVIDYQSSLRVAIPQKVMHGFITEEETLFLSIQNPHIIDPATGRVDIHYEDH